MHILRILCLKAGQRRPEDEMPNEMGKLFRAHPLGQIELTKAILYYMAGPGAFFQH